MSTKKLITPKGQPGIKSFISIKKRSPPDRISSPTTSSPDQKRATVNSNSNLPEAVSNKPGPMVISPQRDKTQKTLDGTDEAVPGKVEQESPQATSTGREATQKTSNKVNNIESKDESEMTNHSKTMIEATTEDYPPSPQEEGVVITESNPKPDIRKDAVQTSKGREERDPVILKSSLKNTYANIANKAASLPEPAPIIPKWEAHRFACMFDIKMPKDKSKRTEYLATELNKMIDCLRDYTKVYVRKYSDFHMPRDSDRTSWISKFDKKKVLDLTLYTFGFYQYQALREGTF